MKEHNDLILELPNFIPESFCEHLINKFESDINKKPGEVMYDGIRSVIPELKNSTEICMCCTSGWECEHNKCKWYLDQAVKLYMLCLKNEYDYNQIKHTFEPILQIPIKYEYTPNIQKQIKGSKYAWHYDGGVTTNELLLIIVYLNTLEPHEGGCTEFGHGRKIRPETGKVMICPASWTYPHCGNEVKGDRKYIISTAVDKIS